MQRELFTQNTHNELLGGAEPGNVTAADQGADPNFSDWFELTPDWLPRSENLLELLLTSIQWQQPKIHVFNKWHKIPRMQAWFGDEQLRYHYSGVDHIADGWPTSLKWVCQKLVANTGYGFNSVLLNRYRDGNDKMGWHADNEPELGHQPAVAIVSLGESRDIQFKCLTTQKTTSLNLPSGSLLFMKPGMQSTFHHQIPVRKRIDKERISLTFRKIIHSTK